MIYTFISAAHIAAAIASMVAGALVVGWGKGTYRHKLAGYAYVTSMLLLNASALLIYRLTGRFGAFHIMALVSLVTLLAGFVPAFLRPRRRGWLDRHLSFMSWSYIGLLMAAASEAAVRIPRAPFWPGVMLGSLGIGVVGWCVLARNRSNLIAAHGVAAAQHGVPGDRPRASRSANG